MPALLGDITVALPNKGGLNNALCKRGKLITPKNGVVACDWMTMCHPLGRLVSMQRYMSRGRMSSESKFVGTDMTTWIKMWLEQRAENSRPNSTNSWFMTLHEFKMACGATKYITLEYDFALYGSDKMIKNTFKRRALHRWTDKQIDLLMGAMEKDLLLWDTIKLEYTKQHIYMCEAAINDLVNAA